MADWRAVRVARGEEGADWGAAVADPAWREGATLLKREAGTSVHRATLRGREVVVKEWVLRGAAALRGIVVPSRADRHWAGARWLHRHQFGTARVLAQLRRRDQGRTRECLVMEALAGRSVLEHLAGGPPGIRLEHALAWKLGVQAANLVRRGRFNRDHKPSNLIVTRLTDRDVRIAIIDCVAIRPCLRRRRALVRMLASLAIEPIGVGHPARRGVMMRTVAGAVSVLTGGRESGSSESRRLRRDLWRRARAAVEAHGDPTPRTDPLGGAARSALPRS